MAKIERMEWMLGSRRGWLVLGRVLLLLGGVSRLSPAGATDDAKQPANDQPAIAKAALLADVAAIGASAPFTLAVRLQLPAGWHTYWTNPGEAGAPTNIDWQLPDGFVAAPIAWPTPERLTSGGIVSYGYAGEVWLTARITPPAGLAPGATVPIAASVDWLVCAEICVPEQAALSLAIPVAASARPAATAISRDFAAAKTRMPRDNLGPLTVTSNGKALDVAVTEPSDATVTKRGTTSGAWFFPATFGQIDDAAPQTFARDASGFRLQLTPAGGGAALPTELNGVLVVEHANRRTGYLLRAKVAS